MSSDASAAAIQQLTDATLNMMSSRYVSIAGLALLLYDHSLTLSIEIQTIWKRTKNLVSWIFLLNRYIVPLVLIIDIYDKAGMDTNLTTQFCQTWTFIENHLHLISLASIHAVVTIRVSAIWGHRRNVKYLLIGLWTFDIVVTMAIGSRATFGSFRNFYPHPTFHVCFGHIASYAYLVWIPPLLLEAVLFLLTVVKAVQQRQESIGNLPVVYVLYRDGLTYFIVISICSIFNLIVWRWAGPSLVLLAKYFTFALVNVMVSRMILNLRILGETADEEDEIVIFVDSRISMDPEAYQHQRSRSLNRLQYRDQLRNLRAERPTPSRHTTTASVPSASRIREVAVIPGILHSTSMKRLRDQMKAMEELPSSWDEEHAFAIEMEPRGGGSPGSALGRRSSDKSWEAPSTSLQHDLPWDGTKKPSNNQPWG